jgi:hypothetical protein
MKKRTKQVGEIETEKEEDSFILSAPMKRKEQDR